jgi:uncharacterized protein (DUF433 family)
MSAHLPSVPPAFDTPDLAGRVAELESRVAHLERLLMEATELPVAPWRHLVSRPRSWRKQLFVRGRNLTVRHVMGALRSEARTPEETAADLDIPVEAVHEAIAYYDQNRDMVDAEAVQERANLTAGSGTAG